MKPLILFFLLACFLLPLSYVSAQLRPLDPPDPPQIIVRTWPINPPGPVEVDPLGGTYLVRLNQRYDITAPTVEPLCTSGCSSAPASPDANPLAGPSQVPPGSPQLTFNPSLSSLHAQVRSMEPGPNAGDVLVSFYPNTGTSTIEATFSVGYGNSQQPGRFQSPWVISFSQSPCSTAPPSGTSGAFSTSLLSENRSMILKKRYTVATTAVPPDALPTYCTAEANYYDGLGRPVQQVTIEMTKPGETSMRRFVTPIEPDYRDRQRREYMPFSATSATPAGFHPDAVVHQEEFYRTKFGKTAPRAFKESLFASGALDRVVSEIFPGIDPSHALENRCDVNTDGDAVYRLSFNSENNTVDRSGNYAAGQLVKTTTTDADGRVTHFFNDQAGRLVMRRTQLGTTWASTYFLYDTRDRLSCVVPPEGTNAIDASPAGALLSATSVADWCFTYGYDSRDRVSVRTIPGKGAEYIVYDRFGRITMIQDAVMRGASQWCLTRYDAFARVVREESIVQASPRDVLQALFDDGTAEQLYATSGRTLLAEYSYDTYASVPSGLSPRNFTSPSFDPGVIDLERVKGMKTWERIYAPEGGCTPVERVFYYDRFGRLVQTAGRNHLGGESYTGSNYDFSGQVTLSHEYHSVGVYEYHSAGVPEYHNVGVLEPGYGLTTAFVYDGGGRITETLSTLHTGATHHIYYIYDDLGRLTTKQYGEGANAFTETCAYTLQGWLREQQSPYFRMHLSYDDVRTASNGHTSMPSYMGNITAWTSEHLSNGAPVNGAKTNHYTYDGLNRLEDAMLHSPSLGTKTDRHTYDLNGNIQHVTENGTIKESYAYTGNRLTALNSVGGYAYDVNGNCTAEGISGLEFAYNFLNLIRTVSRGGVLKATYGWLSDGSKTGVVTPEGGGYEYLGSLTFKRIGGLLSLEGARVDGGRITTTSAGTESLFYITDHLGSTRVVVNGNGAVEARYDYSPFGQEETDGSYPASGNRYRYNGKESQRDVGMEYLDYGARIYNLEGRWLTIDPLAEEYYDISPYVYCLNNPINAIDPDGKQVDWTKNLQTQEYEWMDDVKSREDTPEGYKYVGSNNRDILTDMGVSEKYEVRTDAGGSAGFMGGDGVGPMGQGVPGGIYESVSASLFIRANVSYKSDHVTANNKYGKTFEGVTVTANVNKPAVSGNSDLNTNSQGYLSVINGNQEYAQVLHRPTESHVYKTGTEPTTASVKIPASAISSATYLQSATVNIGYTNPGTIFSIPIKMRWGLQTRIMVRPIKK